MRKIEQQMLNAIRQKKDWRSGNTSVEKIGATEIHVKLFNNLIATIRQDKIYLSNCGYLTATTKSRLNAILSLALKGYGIYQKNYTWYIYDPQQDIADRKEFESGKYAWNEFSVTA